MLARDLALALDPAELLAAMMLELDSWQGRFVLPPWRQPALAVVAPQRARGTPA